MDARMLNAGLGLWVFLSTFFWGHSPAEAYNALLVGMAVVTAAIAGASGARWARYFNALCGLWLLISAFVFSIPGSRTFWNHLLAGALIGSVGLMPNLRAFSHRTPVAP